MSRPFASFEFLNRGWDIRFLETQSLRSGFVWLLIAVFMLGAVTFMLLYETFHQHRFDWTAALLVVVFGLQVVRIAPLIYRRPQSLTGCFCSRRSKTADKRHRSFNEYMHDGWSPTFVNLSSGLF